MVSPMAAVAAEAHGRGTFCDFPRLSGFPSILDSSATSHKNLDNFAVES